MKATKGRATVPVTPPPESTDRTLAAGIADVPFGMKGLELEAFRDAWYSADEALDDQDYLIDNPTVDPSDPLSRRAEIVERIEGPVHGSSSWMEVPDPRALKMGGPEPDPALAKRWRRACDSLSYKLRRAWGFPDSGTPYEAAPRAEATTFHA